MNESQAIASSVINIGGMVSGYVDRQKRDSDRIKWRREWWREGRKVTEYEIATNVVENCKIMRIGIMMKCIIAVDIRTRDNTVATHRVVNINKISID